jgi:hypothetical protein
MPVRILCLNKYTKLKITEYIYKRKQLLSKQKAALKEFEEIRQPERY